MVEEECDQMRARVPSCLDMLSRTRLVWAALGSCRISGKKLFSLALKEITLLDGVNSD